MGDLAAAKAALERFVGWPCKHGGIVTTEPLGVSFDPSDKVFFVNAGSAGRVATVSLAGPGEFLVEVVVKNIVCRRWGPLTVEELAEDIGKLLAPYLEPAHPTEVALRAAKLRGELGAAEVLHDYLRENKIIRPPARRVE